ncbi:hypothetical protein V2J09_008216 [Rumex salicifolius]
MGNCVDKEDPKKKSTAEIAPSDYISRGSVGVGVNVAGGEAVTPPVSSKLGSTGVGGGEDSGGAGKMFAIKSRGAEIGSGGGGGKSPVPDVMLYGHPTSLHTYYLRFALLQKPVALDFAPSIFEMSLFTLEFGKDDVVSGSAETMLQVMDARFPEPPLLVKNLKQGREWDEATPFLVRMSVLQHRSMRWHLDRIVRWASDLTVRGGKAAVDPAVGTPKMEVRKFGKSYGQLYDFLLEHAQMEEKVVFPILQKEDRGLCKCAIQQHARDLPIMNGIKEAIKSIGALDAGTPDHREALRNVCSRLDVLQENFRQHFVEEERNVFPLFEAVDLSKEQQRTTMQGCIAEMQGTHSHLFRFFMEGLQPHEAVQYMDLVIYSMDKDNAICTLGRLKNFQQLQLQTGYPIHDKDNAHSREAITDYQSWILTSMKPKTKGVQVASMKTNKPDENASSRNEPSDWSTVPETMIPAQVEHDPARHEYGRSRPISSAASKMVVSSGTSNSVSSPSGFISFTLCTAMAETLKGEDLILNVLEMLFKDPIDTWVLIGASDRVAGVLMGQIAGELKEAILIPNWSF